MVVLSTDPDEARSIVSRYEDLLGLPNYYNNLARLGFEEHRSDGSDRLVDAIVAWGTEDQIAVNCGAS